ncbi:hypothetical protein ACS0TY_034017 [Phlomoides rotata]
MGNTDKRIAVQLVLQHGVYSLLLGCLIDGDEQVASASTDAIKALASYPEGMGINFPANMNEGTHPESLTAKSSSRGRVRVLALIVKLFSTSSSVASEVSKSNLLNLLEAEVPNSNNTLLLSSIISNGAAESILRSRAMMITGRLLSKENAFAFNDESSRRNVLPTIDKRFDFLESREADEVECALEALGQIGSSFQGAIMILSTSPPIARYVVDAAFDRQQHGKQLAALHSLGNITGETRTRNTVLLTSAAEENLRSLIYDKASKTSKLAPSGLPLSILQQDSEIRIAGYKLISGLSPKYAGSFKMIERVEHVRAERNLLAEVGSHCIVKLYYSFQDPEYLYIIIEYLPGGDMMTMLKKGYSMGCDWWSWGAIMKTVHWRNHLSVPEDAKLSHEAKDLVCRLLCDVEHRLGTGGAAKIKAHPWFVNVEWDRLYEMEAAFKPEVNGELDIQNFMKFDELNTIKVWIRTFEQDDSYIKGFEFCGIYLHEATWESIWSFRRNFLIFCLRTSKKSRGGIVMIEEDEAIFPLEESHEEGRIAAELKHPFL